MLSCFSLTIFQKNNNLGLFLIASRSSYSYFIKVRKILLTGYPGFLGSRIVSLLLDSDPDTKIICLVQEKFIDLAQNKSQLLQDPSRIEILLGDISIADLGIADWSKYQNEIEEIYHFAAVYNLSVKKKFAHKVNVDGTQHILEFEGFSLRKHLLRERAI